MSKISELSDGGVIQGGDTLIAVRSGGNVKVTYGGTTTANIDGGTIDGTVIGGTTAAAGSFTTGSFTGDVSFGDSDKAVFGAGSDLQIYHDGGNSRILENGTGFLAIGTNGGEISLRGDSFNDYMLKAEQNSAVTLYHNALPKLATTSTGIDVTGKAHIAYTTAATANRTYGLIVNGDDSGTVGESSSIFLSGLNATTRGASIAAEIQSAGNDHDLIFATSASGATPAERMRIDSSGNVGIGSSSPAAKLDVVKTGAGIQDTLQLRNAQTLAAGVGSSLGFGDSGGARLAYIAGAATGSNNDNGYLSFYTRASDSLAERMRIDSSGLVAIGTSSPVSTAQLTVGGTSRIAPVSGNGLLLASGGSDRMFISTAGNVGIGTSSPNSIVDIRENATGGQARLRLFNTDQTNSTAQSALLFMSPDLRANGVEIEAVKENADFSAAAGRDIAITFSPVLNNAATERMRIDSAGRVGIGTSSPSSNAKLDVNGIIRANVGSGGLSLSGYSAPDMGYFSYNYTNSNGTEVVSQAIRPSHRISMGNGAQNAITFDYRAGNAAAGAFTERMRIDSSGNVGIGTDNPARNLSVVKSGGAVLQVADSAQGQGSNDGFLIVQSGVNTSLEGRENGFMNFLTNATERMRIDSSGNAGIGTSSPALSSKLNVSSTTTALDSGGTIFASVTDAVAANIGGQVMMGGYYTGTTTAAFGGIAAKKENATNGNYAGYLQFLTSTNGSGNTEKMRIDATGNLLVGASSSHLTSKLNVTQPANSIAGYVYASLSSGYTSTVFSVQGNQGTTNESYVLADFLNASGNGRCKIFDSGDVDNTNGAYGSLSDVKLKTDITDAGSQWEDIKAIRFRKYKMIADPEQRVQMGVIAQELEESGMSGLVRETNDKDVQGNDLGTTTKSVKYSIMYTKAVKALQEAMVRIETLEAEVTALKGA